MSSMMPLVIQLSYANTRRMEGSDYKSHHQKMFCKANPSCDKKIPFSCISKKILNSSCHMFPSPVSGWIVACIIFCFHFLFLRCWHNLKDSFSISTPCKKIYCCEVFFPHCGQLFSFSICFFIWTLLMWPCCFSVWLQVSLQELLNLLDEFCSDLTEGQKDRILRNNHAPTRSVNTDIMIEEWELNSCPDWANIIVSLGSW